MYDRRADIQAKHVNDRCLCNSLTYHFCILKKHDFVLLSNWFAMSVCSMRVHFDCKQTAGMFDGASIAAAAAAATCACTYARTHQTNKCIRIQTSAFSTNRKCAASNACKQNEQMMQCTWIANRIVWGERIPGYILPIFSIFIHYV